MFVHVVLNKVWEKQYKLQCCYHNKLQFVVSLYQHEKDLFQSTHWIDNETLQRYLYELRNISLTARLSFHPLHVNIYYFPLVFCNKIPINTISNHFSEFISIISVHPWRESELNCGAYWKQDLICSKYFPIYTEFIGYWFLISSVNKNLWIYWGIIWPFLACLWNFCLVVYINKSLSDVSCNMFTKI